MTPRRKLPNRVLLATERRLAQVFPRLLGCQHVLALRPSKEREDPA